MEITLRNVEKEIRKNKEKGESILIIGKNLPKKLKKYCETRKYPVYKQNGYFIIDLLLCGNM
jgi:capsule polysaccharide export protein KpsC/LpsZ